jgi:hypothetical protein
MKKMRLSLLVVLLLSCSALIFSCGGGGGSSSGSGNSGGTAVTSSNASQAASGALEAAKLFTTAGVVSGVQSTASVAGSHKAGGGPVRSVINEAMDIISGGSKKSASSLKQATDMVPCDSGTMDISGSGNDASVSFHSCQKGSSFFDGSMSMQFEGDANTPSRITITMPNLRASDSYDGFDITFKNFSMDVNNIHWSGYYIDGMTVVLNGDAAGKVDLAALDSMDISCDNYTGTFQMVTGGETLSVSGSVRTSTCFDEWLSISTTTPVFVPDGAECPTDGEVVCSYGGNNIRVVMHSDQQEAIYFNDNLIKTFDNCTEADTVCF